MRVAVLGGGRSSEHDVSLASAESVRAGLAQGGHEPIEVLIERDGRWMHDGEQVTLEPSGGLLGADAVFPVLHGPFGEDGTVQGLLDLLDVPYVGAGVLASSVSMDKAVFKELMAAHGVPQGDYAVVRAGGGADHVRPAGVREARAAGVVGGHLEGGQRGGAGPGDRAGVRARPGGCDRAADRGDGGRVLGARQRGPAGVDPGRDRDPERLVRLRDEVHRGRDGAGGAGPHAPPGGRPATGGGGLQDRRMRRDGARGLLRDRGRGARERAEHDPRASRPRACTPSSGTRAECPTRNCWTGCWSWRWNGTPPSGNTGTSA